MSPAAVETSSAIRVRWLALAFAFAATPALPEIARQTLARPESAYVWLAPMLASAETARRRHEHGRPRPVAGSAGLVLALAAMGFGVLAGSPTLAWAGIATGLLALAIRAGWPTPGAVAPLLAWVPLPLALPLALSPGLEAIWAAGVSGLMNGLGSPIERVGSQLTTAGGARIEFFGVDDGLVLAHGFALLGTWHASRHALQGAQWCTRVGAFALAGFALQGGVLVAAAVCLVALGAHAGRTVLWVGPSMLVLAGCAFVRLVSARHAAVVGPGAADVARAPGGILAAAERASARGPEGPWTRGRGK